MNRMRVPFPSSTSTSYSIDSTGGGIKRSCGGGATGSSSRVSSQSKKSAPHSARVAGAVDMAILLLLHTKVLYKRI
ncbi:MAG: hypothetical protein WC518_03610 [Patescibacteria group bacterium]